MRILLVEDLKKVSAFVEPLRDGHCSGWEKQIGTRGNMRVRPDHPGPHLPKVDGREVRARVRGKNTTVPVLVLTARDSVDDKVQIFDQEKKGQAVVQ